MKVEAQFRAEVRGRLRPMTEEDLDSVMVIESLCFRAPWSRGSFEAEFQKPFSTRVVFAEQDGIAGYVVAWRIEDELHIANLAVHPTRRRAGIAETLLRHVLEAEPGVSWIGLEVRASNASARALYRKLGFHEAGVRKEYYADEGEDAVLMVKSVHSE